jgi:hypothetical protein
MNSVGLKLDIACGKTKKAGFIGVDIWEGADIVCDLETFPWPFDDDSVDELFCSHYIEHTPDLISFANELHRIMRVGAKAQIIAPYYSSIRAWQDPTHLRAISENTFLYFNREWRMMNRLDHYAIFTDFDFEYRFILDPSWVNKSNEELTFAIKHYINVVTDIDVSLIKRNPVDDKYYRLSELWSTGKCDEAARISNQLIMQGEIDCSLFLIIAEHAFVNKNYSSSIEKYQQVLELDEESLQAHCGLVKSYNLAGREVDARLHLSEIRKSDPELADLIEEIISVDDN